MKLCSVCKQRIPVALLKSGERICDECVIAQLTAAEKRASEAEAALALWIVDDGRLTDVLSDVINAQGSDESLEAALKAIKIPTPDAPARAQAVADCVQELRNIAAANRKDWECSMDEFIDQFQPWAQSRARCALAALAKLDAARKGE